MKYQVFNSKPSSVEVKVSDDPKSNVIFPPRGKVILEVTTEQETQPYRDAGLNVQPLK